MALSMEAHALTVVAVQGSGGFADEVGTVAVYAVVQASSQTPHGRHPLSLVPDSLSPRPSRAHNRAPTVPRAPPPPTSKASSRSWRGARCRVH